jgi:type IV pilus assembly protein PilB
MSDDNADNTDLQPAQPPTADEVDRPTFIDLWSPPDDAAGPPPSLGEHLLSQAMVTRAQLDTANTMARRSPGKAMEQIFLDLGVDEPALRQAVATRAGITMQRVQPAQIEAVRELDALGLDHCQSHGVLPLHYHGRRLLLGVTDPSDLMAIEEVRHKVGRPIKPVVVSAADIETVIADRKEETSGSTVEVDEIIAEVDEDDVEVEQNDEEEDLNLEQIAGESPVIRFVNYLIFNAVKEGASDIHIEPQEKKLQVRYRIDGVMFEMMNPPPHMHAAIISRLKIMANLDIAERRLPQDGRIRAMVHGRKLDLRVSTLPCAQGEKSVLRILDTRSIQVNLDELGMDHDTLTLWKHSINQPHGILLVTGPTGSGKTTTLYASLGQMDKRQQNISTVEDPVEYHLNGINQTQVHDTIGMSFGAALRALLRQDPDVIMVGEIRDADTAKTAIQAALTGHLVLSTLHTNDAPSSVTRLINIGVEPYLIGSAVSACLAQRLVRRNCPHCVMQVPPDEKTSEHLAMHGIFLDQVWQGQGCDKCRNTGYTGRLGLYELLVLDDVLRDRISSNPSVTEFRRTCVERGMVTLREDGFKKVAAGQTTVEEVLRVTESTI